MTEKIKLTEEEMTVMETNSAECTGFRDRFCIVVTAGNTKEGAEKLMLKIIENAEKLEKKKELKSYKKKIRLKD